MLDNNINQNIEEENALVVQENSFFNILKVRMGEYKEFKTEQKNMRAVEAFQNMILNNDLSEISKSTVRNTPFDENVVLDEKKYQL